MLEAAAAHVGEGGRVTVEVAREAMQKRFARYDKAGEEHFNLLSAYHKSLRGSDPQGALYWMARMIDGGRGSDDAVPPRHRHGGRGHRPGRSRTR